MVISGPKAHHLLLLPLCGNRNWRLTDLNLVRASFLKFNLVSETLNDKCATQVLARQLSQHSASYMWEQTRPNSPGVFFPTVRFHDAKNTNRSHKSAKSPESENTWHYCTSSDLVTKQGCFFLQGVTGILCLLQLQNALCKIFWNVTKITDYKNFTKLASWNKGGKCSKQVCRNTLFFQQQTARS